MSWQLQEAKNKFSEVVNRAIDEGPQEITRRGESAVIVLSIDDYKKMSKKNGTIVDFFKNSPLADLDLKRIKDFPRDFSLWNIY